MFAKDGKRIYFRSEQKYHRVGLILEWPENGIDARWYQTISACNKFSLRSDKLPKLYTFENDSDYDFCKNCTKPSSPHMWTIGYRDSQGKEILARRLTNDEVLEIYAAYPD